MERHITGRWVYSKGEVGESVGFAKKNRGCETPPPRDAFALHMIIDVDLSAQVTHVAVLGAHPSLQADSTT